MANTLRQRRNGEGGGGGRSSEFSKPVLEAIDGPNHEGIQHFDGFFSCGDNVQQSVKEIMRESRNVNVHISSEGRRVGYYMTPYLLVERHVPSPQLILWRLRVHESGLAGGIFLRLIDRRRSSCGRACARFPLRQKADGVAIYPENFQLSFPSKGQFWNRFQVFHCMRFFFSGHKSFRCLCWGKVSVIRPSRQ